LRDALLEADSKHRLAREHGTLQSSNSLSSGSSRCRASSVKRRGERPDQTRIVAGGSSKEQPRDSRNGAIRLAPVIAGSVVGVLFAFRALALWESGSRDRIPTGGLVYLGSVFLIGGLLQLHPRLWRRSRDANIRAWRRSWGRPLDRDSGKGRIVFAIQEWLVAREERERDIPSYRYRAAMIGIAAGATIIISALLR
jgi:hypothetical protein